MALPLRSLKITGRPRKCLPLGFELKFRKLTVLIGVNGSGKTAVHQTILQVYANSVGNLHFDDGVELDLGLDDIAKVNIAAMYSEKELSYPAGTKSLDIFVKRGNLNKEAIWNAYLLWKLRNKPPPDHITSQPIWQIFVEEFPSSSTSDDTSEADVKREAMEFLAKRMRDTHVSHLTTARSTVDKLLTRTQKSPSLPHRREALTQLNQYLCENGFKPAFQVAKCLPDGENGRLSSQLVMSMTSNGEGYSDHDLSGGEKIQLLCLLWRHPELHAEHGLLLLDEPDAHLHASLCQDFIQSLLELLKHQNLQVIMTTHNATTARFLPKDSDIGSCCAIYKLEAGEQPQPIERHMAVKYLTQNLVMVTEPVSIVFCEAENDEKFYIGLYRRFFKLCSSPEATAWLQFRAHGLSGKKNSSCNEVESLVGKLADDKDLRNVNNIFRGIMDFDNRKDRRDNPRIAKKQLATGQRHSLENYCFDPVVIAATLLKIHEDAPKSKELENVWMDSVANFTLEDEVKSLKKLLHRMMNGESLFESDLALMQKVIDEWGKKILEKLDEIMAPDAPETVSTAWRKKRKEIAEYMHATNNAKRVAPLVTSEQRADVLDVKVVPFAKKLRYPSALLLLKGHFLVDVCRELWPQLRKSHDVRDLAAKMLPPFEDLMDMFKALQSPLALKMTVSEE
ncbi:hypothetical protein HDU85_003559 [Gaertneriomyces sp. JEL0708]|nr:hypothetical protein HDU85_003559 [Gaertneriomyces sp. JEL0708]